MTIGLLSVQSNLSFDDTVIRAQEILKAEGFGIPLMLSHQDNAALVNMELAPTTVIMFGNPNVGTSLMQESRTMAIDLPQKFLIWEDETGTVNIVYNDPFFFANRHGITEQTEKLNKTKNRLQSLAETIAKA